MLKCGHKHAFYKWELCPAFGKIYKWYHKPTHIAVYCHQKSQSASVKEEVYHTSALTSEPDDAQLVTLKLESGNYMRFQVDTGALCDVIPVELTSCSG